MTREFRADEQRFLECVQENALLGGILKDLRGKPFEFNDEDITCATLLLAAVAATVFLDEESEFHPETVLLFLSRITLEYGCWLDNVSHAIERAKFDSPEERALFEGAFLMAKHHLFALFDQRRNSLQPSTSLGAPS
jgi:hypothetical protein